ARRGVRRRYGRRVRRASTGALRSWRAGRRPPADAPPREGARVRGGIPAPRRGEGAALQARAAQLGGDRGGASAALRRAHAPEAPSGLDVDATAEPLPLRARDRSAPETTRATRRGRAPAPVRDAQAVAP